MLCGRDCITVKESKSFCLENVYKNWSGLLCSTDDLVLQTGYDADEGKGADH